MRVYTRRGVYPRIPRILASNAPLNTHSRRTAKTATFLLVIKCNAGVIESTLQQLRQPVDI